MRLGKGARALRKIALLGLFTVLGSLLGVGGLYVYLVESSSDLDRWHVVELREEFTVEKQDSVRTFEDYLELEARVFRELEEKVYRPAAPVAPWTLTRYSHGSLADPTAYERDWNRSYELVHPDPRGGVLLLHGLSDSPYSLRALATMLHDRGYTVLGLRMPGHGTAPSGLVHATWEDLAAAVRIAVDHVSRRIGADRPLTLVGFSMGGAQAVYYALSALEDRSLRRPDSLILLSPAIGVSGAAAFAKWQARISTWLGLHKLGWTDIGPEYDPYKYVSFAVNAGDLIYRLTLEIGQKLEALQDTAGAAEFPRTLAFLSAVDATISADSVVSHLLDRVDNTGNELVLFDLNRFEGITPFLKNDPKASIDALLGRETLRFTVSLVTNASAETRDVVCVRRAPEDESTTTESLSLTWPQNLYSLSHVALPFPPNDPLYGKEPPDGEQLHLGALQSRGEKGVLHVSASDMLRIRHNPFYSFLEQRIEAFLGLR